MKGRPDRERGAFEPVRLTRAQEDDAVDVLAKAFVDDPLLRYVCPEDAKRLGETLFIIRTVVSFGLRYGQIWTTPGKVRAAAIWTPPGAGRVTLQRRIRTGMIFERFKLGRGGSRRYNLYKRFAGELHQQLVQGPHWYLFVIGVDPEAQGTGLGSALIGHMLERTDRGRLPVYLTAPNGAVVPFYERLGFRVTGEAGLPDGGLHLRGLVRQPLAQLTQADGQVTT